ncbi:GntR family transcriptional regulator [Ancylobacter sp. A5.8]|uniref:GntR family transcriptional regulator n=1 Tax=Ancylobacter gelatini TaxID=2919920 RepID=UPI001F4E2B05|nr:GntR family transcriptional regulator [Ancylobacter gelatini]
MSSENLDAVEAAALRVADSLREGILSGQMPSGTPLREAALSTTLNVSRNTLREALRELASEGLIEQELYKGAKVRAMTSEDVLDIFVVRRALQFRAVEQSAYASRERLDMLATLVDVAERAAEAGDWQQVGTASLRFHHGIVGLIGSRRLDRFFEVIMAQLSLALADARNDENFQSHWILANHEIADHLLSGRRKEAAHALGDFIDESERLVLDIVRNTWASRSTAPRKWSPKRQ